MYSPFLISFILLLRILKFCICYHLKVSWYDKLLLKIFIISMICTLFIIYLVLIFKEQPNFDGFLIVLDFILVCFSQLFIPKQLSDKLNGTFSDKDSNNLF